MGILLRFRRFRVGLQADIEKMYLQVSLHPEDRHACRFLWTDARGGKAPREYRLIRVYFGQRPLWFRRLVWQRVRGRGLLASGSTDQELQLAQVGIEGSSTLCLLGHLCETGSRLTDQELLLLERQFSGSVLNPKRRAAMEAICGESSTRYPGDHSSRLVATLPNARQPA
ncbi:hypothetical protein T11_13082 [Trichinella zimbabwensis]|uniref:Uncharacterized protein n=1 Tax=Trichinella zimbabwensis TaxID=268475 RepID=A0A0V1GX08_9BILA|nr:hypothetical protein T11_13082 [Trichinella zimbabwensis]